MLSNDDRGRDTVELLPLCDVKYSFLAVLEKRNLGTEPDDAGPPESPGSYVCGSGSYVRGSWWFYKVLKIREALYDETGGIMGHKGFVEFLSFPRKFLLVIVVVVAAELVCGKNKDGTEGLIFQLSSMNFQSGGKLQFKNYRTATKNFNSSTTKNFDLD
uniref:Uncharacterized protein n=1 Tax=Romanomermis culicivorax TaxID=13658 RepID=A0A915KAP3_ROMCU